MEPHELVQRLFEARKDITSVSALARAIHNQGFQGTLHKFLTGRTASPDQKTAARIAKFFGLPIEAIYDARVATRIAQERGLIDAKGGAPLVAREAENRYEPAPPAWPFKQVSATDLAKLSPPAMKQLERLVAAFIGGPVPTGIDPDEWIAVARTLATSMDQALGKDVYMPFALKVEELLKKGAGPRHASPTLVN